ncbi:hypothetical protein SAMN04487958_10165 [Vreelandella subterranea]|uniref:Uncharacterized protein n=1 Tax=Vreelandella subterranea TaxID=416874 RepID=A0A1H9P2X0_9GAMM|nr:hypothetical protein [Halomonas subterranea]SER42255.1 hypothetical protein SAMN04487958_10165 [Halomonas subterranea]
MMKKECFKKLGILGVSFALMSSPLAFADMHEEDEPNTGTQEQADLDGSQDSMDAAVAEDQNATDILDNDEPKVGTTQQSDLDEESDSMSSPEVDDGHDLDDPNVGTQEQSDLDED